MSTCNQLDLQTLESQPVMPKNLPNHRLQYNLLTLRWRLSLSLGAQETLTKKY